MGCRNFGKDCETIYCTEQNEIPFPLRKWTVARYLPVIFFVVFVGTWSDVQFTISNTGKVFDIIHNN